VILGEGVTVGANAVIVGPTSLGPRTRVGVGALVCRSVLWSASDVGEGAFIDASVIGDGFVVPPLGAVHGEVKMNRLESDGWWRRLVPTMPPPNPGRLAFP
jgi:NDP-sugar pyrophosphorylase family protein